jgi:hypothetical protein
VTTNGPVSTNVLWSNIPNNGLYVYSEGFTNVQVPLIGSPYKAANLPLSLADPAVFLSGGGLATTLTDPVTLEHKTSYLSSNVTLRINATSGSFSGWFTNASNGKLESISGVILQNTNSARGYFLGKDASESGEVLLRSQ